MRHLAFGLAILTSASASADSPAPAVTSTSRLAVSTFSPPIEPAPDAPEPAPLEIEPAPSEFEPPPSLRLATLPKVVPTAAERRYHWPLWRVLTGSALVIGGGVMFGFGMSALAYDGVCVPIPPPGVLACRRYYDTKDKGVALAVSGVLTAVGGGLLIAIPSRRTRPKLTAQLVLPNVGVAIGGNF